MQEKVSSPEALKAALQYTLINSGITKEVWDKVEQGTAINRGELQEILVLGESEELRQFVEKNGIESIETYEDFAAKLNELIARVEEMEPAEAFDFVKDWLQKSRLASNAESLAHSYISIGETMDRRNVTALDTVEGDQSFKQQLGHDHLYDETLQLPGRFDFSSRGDAEKITEYLAELKKLEGRKQEAVAAVRYKNALLTKLLTSRLAQATKDHIGTDLFDQSPIVHKDDVHSYQEAQRYFRKLPPGMNVWVRRNLRREFFMADYDHLEFFQEPKRMKAIVGIVLPDGDQNAFYKEYVKALNAFKKPNRSMEIERTLHTALQDLQKEIYKHCMTAFGECKENLHPQVECQARNIAWYALTTGEGAKVSSYWSKIQPLKQNGFINDNHAPPLSTSAETLREIAYAEGIELTPVKNEIASRLREDQVDQAAVADLIENAYEVMQKGGDPLTVAKRGEENWYVITALFRTADQREKMEFDDGQPRRYGAVLELAQFIRDFKRSEIQYKS